MTTERNAQGVDVLAPCPFCGSSDVKAYIDGTPGWTTRVCCHECGCASGFSPTLAEAVADWNHRPQATALAELIAAIRPLASLDLRPDGFDKRPDSQPVYARDNSVITVGDVRRAAAALSNIEGGKA